MENSRRFQSRPDVFGQKSKRSGINFIRYRSNTKDQMTYIIGARCADGVCLISDRKLLRGSIPTYKPKLYKILNSVVMGGAGSRAIVDRFSDEIVRQVDSVQIKNYVDLLNYVEDRSADLNRRYGYRGGRMELLMGWRIGSEAELFNIVTESGIAEPIKDCFAIGSGEPYGSLLLQKFWNEDLNMLDFAKVGYLLIEYVKKFNLEDSVGGTPQVWLIPDILEAVESPEEAEKKYPIREANQDELTKMVAFSNDKLDQVEQFVSKITGKETISSVSK